MSWRCFSSEANSLETHPSLGDGWDDKGGLPPGSAQAYLNAPKHTQSMLTHADINSCKRAHDRAHRYVYSHKSGAQTESALSDSDYRLGQREGGGMGIEESRVERDMARWSRAVQSKRTDEEERGIK